MACSIPRSFCAARRGNGSDLCPSAYLRSKACHSATGQQGSKPPRSHRRSSSLAPSHQSIGRTTTRTFQSQTCKAAVSDAVTGSKEITYTSFEGNTWSFAFPRTGVKMLVDPWLVGNLTFADQEWLYKGTKTAPMPTIQDIEASTDFILLSQGLPDHAHVPTLKIFPKHIPVVASPSGAAICRDLGFTDVRSLEAEEHCTVCDGKLRIRATEGALVGPPWSKREAGFIMKEMRADGISVYYEPHCDYVESSIAPHAPVDVVISPVVSESLAGFPLVLGHENAIKLMQTLKPSLVIPLMNNTFQSEGPLTKQMSTTGTVHSFPARLKEAGLEGIRVAIPDPPVPMSVTL